jgi:hypothetical protein
LTQAGKELDPGIAVGRLKADLKLIVAHGDRGAGADTAVGAACVEAERGVRR